MADDVLQPKSNRALARCLERTRPLREDECVVCPTVLDALPGGHRIIIPQGMINWA